MHILIHRQTTRGSIHQSTPLPTIQFVVLRRQRLYLLVGPMALMGFGEDLAVHRCRGIDGILNSGKPGVHQFWTHQRTTFYQRGFNTLKIGHASCSLSGSQRYLRDWRQTTRVFLLIQFHLCVSGEFRASLTTKTEELIHGRIEPTPRLLTKLTTEPVPIMVTDGLCTDTVDVPSHIEEEFQVIARHLHIVHVGNPEFADMMIIGLTHLVIDKSWLSRRQPEVVVRTSPVAEMIIDTSPTLSLLLVGI